MPRELAHTMRAKPDDDVEHDEPIQIAFFKERLLEVEIPAAIMT